VTRWAFAPSCPSHGLFIVFPVHADGIVGTEPLCHKCQRPIPRRGTFVVEAERWFDARAAAIEVFHTDELAWSETTAAPELRLRWEGHDAGPLPTRRLVRQEQAVAT
jgi:hypothetical protein